LRPSRTMLSHTLKPLNLIRLIQKLMILRESRMENKFQVEEQAQARVPPKRRDQLLDDQDHELDQLRHTQKAYHYNDACNASCLLLPSCPKFAHLPERQA